MMSYFSSSRKDFLLFQRFRPGGFDLAGELGNGGFLALGSFEDLQFRRRRRGNPIHLRLAFCLAAMKLLLRKVPVVHAARTGSRRSAFRFQGSWSHFPAARRPETWPACWQRPGRHDADVFDFDRLNRNAPLLGDVGQLLLELQDDAPPLPQNILNRHIGDLVPDGGLDHVLQDSRRSSERVFGAVEVETRDGPLRRTDLPDGKAADLHALVLRRDLIGGKGDAVGRGREDVVAVDQAATSRS
jgi:hypothetical protein